MIPESPQKIENISKEILLHAIRTLPISPYAGHINMGLGIMRETLMQSEEDLLVYLSECKMRGIIPSSVQTLEYREDLGLFVSSGREYIQKIYSGYSKEINQKKVNALLNGGKIESYIIKFGTRNYRKNAFEYLQKDLLDEMVKREYFPSEGSIWTLEHCNGLIEFKEGLELKLVQGNNPFELELNKKLLSWFEEVKRADKGSDLEEIPF